MLDDSKFLDNNTIRQPHLPYLIGEPSW